MLRRLLLNIVFCAVLAGGALADARVKRLGSAPPEGPPPEAVFAGGTPMTVTASMPPKIAAGRASPPQNPAAPGTPPTALAAGYAFSPFTVSRSNKTPDKPYLETRYPYRAVGRLAFRYQGQNTWCTAALIDKGLLVTSGSCVAGFGQGFFPDGRWAFIPGYHKGLNAYGTFQYRDVFVPAAYLNGSDRCIEYGAGCVNDVAVIVLKPNRRNQYPGTLTGWLRWTDYGSFFFIGPYFGTVPVAQVTQLGYTSDLAYWGELLRNDAPAFLPSDWNDSALFGAISDAVGQPLIIDFDGLDLFEKDLPFFATYSAPNTIVGVTSFIVFDGLMGRQFLAGATVFTEENIGALVAEACKAYPDACSR